MTAVENNLATALIAQYKFAEVGAFYERALMRAEAGRVLTEGPTRGSFRLTGGAGVDSCSATYGVVTTCESGQQSRSLFGVQQHRAYLALVMQ